MSNSTDEESTHSSGTDEPENYESNDADSLNFDEEEENNSTSGFPLSCNLSSGLVGGSIVLRIDQSHRFSMNDSATATATTTETSVGRMRSDFPFSISILQGPMIRTTSSRAASTAAAQLNLSSGSDLPPGLLHADHSVSRTTSLSDTASDNMSTRAVMGDTSSTNGANGAGGGEDDADNSSQASLADSEAADRVRRIHSSIFSSLENDLAELVRIREETIQFLETGSRARASHPLSNGTGSGGTGGGESSQENQENQNQQEASATNATTTAAASGTGSGVGAGPRGDPFILRERLTFHARPFSSFNDTFPRLSSTSSGLTLASDPNTITMGGRSYTPIAKFDSAPPGSPAKPFLETGLKGCDEKAACARKVLDKLLYGDPEDESASFVRRFWRETATQDAPPPVIHAPSPISLDIAAMAERTASLEATLEEAFDSIRLRLQQAAAESSSAVPSSSPNRDHGNRDDRNRQENETGANQENNDPGNEISGAGTGRLVDPNSVPYYQSWDEETSIMNNPLNYDIWNELDDGNNQVGPTITVRINLAERRANARNRIRNMDMDTGRSSNPRGGGGEGNGSNTVGVGTSTSMNIDPIGNEGAEPDDDSTDDEEISNYFRFRARADSILNRRRQARSGGTVGGERSHSSSLDLDADVDAAMQNLNDQSREIFHEIGISEDLGRDLFNMFTFSSDEVSLPPRSRDGGPAPSTADENEMPEPLFPRNECYGSIQNHQERRESRDYNCRGNNNCDDDNDRDKENHGHMMCTEDDEDPPPMIPLLSTESGFELTVNREDDCSSRVYLDENNLNFPYELNEDEDMNQD